MQVIIPTSASYSFCKAFGGICHRKLIGKCWQLCEDPWQNLPCGSRRQTENFHFSNSTPTSWSQVPLTKTGSLCLGWNEGVVKNKSSSSHPPWPGKGERPIQRVGQLECYSPWLLWKDNTRTGPLHRMAFSNGARRTCCIRLNTQLLAAVALSLWLLLWAVAPSSIKWDSNTCPSHPRGTGNIKVNNIWKSTWKRVLGTILIILGFLWLWAYFWAC